MKKALVIAYFVVLFGILGSFLYGSSQEPEIWFHVGVTDEFSDDYANRVLVWVRSPENAVDFSGYEIETRWYEVRKRPGVGRITRYSLGEDVKKSVVSRTGKTAVRVPDYPEVHLEGMDKSILGQFSGVDPELIERRSKLKAQVEELKNLMESMPQEFKDQLGDEMDSIEEVWRDFPVDLLGDVSEEVAPKPFALEISLYDPRGELQKRAIIPAMYLPVERGDMVLYFNRDGEGEEAQIKEIGFYLDYLRERLGGIYEEPSIKMGSQALDDQGQSLYRFIAPGALLPNVPTEVMVVTLTSEGAYRGEVNIEQIHGAPAVFPSRVMTDGVVKFNVSIQTIVDLKLTAGDKEFYASLGPAEKPISVSVSQALVMPESHPTLKVEAFGSRTALTIDYFDGHAWLGRQTVSAESSQQIELRPEDYVIEKDAGEAPKLIYARVSNTDVGRTEDSQTVALISTKRAMTVMEQAKYALLMLEKEGVEEFGITGLNRLLEEDATQIYLAQNIRDYALTRLAQHHDVNFRMLIRTDEVDRARFEAEKAARKRVSNILLMIWFGVGICLGGMMLRQSRRRAHVFMSRMQIERGGDGFVEYTEDRSGIILLIVVVLLIGFMVSLYYMMQIV